MAVWFGYTEASILIERVGPVLYADQKQSWWDAHEFAGRMGLQVVYGPYDSTMVGLNAEDALQDQSIAQATGKLIELLKGTLGIDVAAGDIRLLFGTDYGG